MITPRTLKGFRDYLPELMIPRERLIDTARRVYRSYGFSPIDTPALEYLEILTGKGGDETDKQLYRFKDHGGREVGLRFDLTVPLARFAAQHIAELGTPFKRYHIATVWRGENTQRGRYREFMQCDFDTIGTLSPVADIETALVIHDLLRALGFERFTIHVNNRLVLNGLLEKLGLADKSKPMLARSTSCTRSAPTKSPTKWSPPPAPRPSKPSEVLRLAEIDGHERRDPAATRTARRRQRTGPSGRRQTGRTRSPPCKPPASPRSDCRSTPSIARGLDYYTGTIFETFLDALPDIGSVCSGGRYDNLAALYTKQQLPGIGASLGLDRLLAGMEELGMLAESQHAGRVFIPYFDAARLHDYLRLAAKLRAAGIGVEVYPEPKKLGQQLKYADRRGFRVALVAGENEFAAGTHPSEKPRHHHQRNRPLTPDAADLIARLRELLA